MNRSGQGPAWQARSARLAYRALGHGDAAALHEIVAHEAVTRQLGPAWPWPADPAYTAGRAAASHEDGFLWGVFHAESLVGTVGVTGGELGYMIDPRSQRRGFAREACGTALARAFGPLGLGAVRAGVWADNAASLGLLESLGFRVTGHSLASSAARPVASPGYDLGLDRETWAALEP